MILRLIFVVNLGLGIYFWTGHDSPLVLVHMLLGIVFVALLWLVGVAQAMRGGSLGLTLGTFVLGLALALVGFFQNGALPIQIVHLLLALTAIGLAEMAAGRFKKLSAAAVSAA